MLRTLHTIDEVIINPEISRSHQEIVHNNRIVRSTSVALTSIVKMWRCVLALMLDRCVCMCV